jgi:hypothetical protein
MLATTRPVDEDAERYQPQVLTCVFFGRIISIAMPDNAGRSTVQVGGNSLMRAGARQTRFDQIDLAQQHAVHVVVDTPLFAEAQQLFALCL